MLCVEVFKESEVKWLCYVDVLERSGLCYVDVLKWSELKSVMKY